MKKNGANILLTILSPLKGHDGRLSFLNLYISKKTFDTQKIIP